MRGQAFFLLRQFESARADFELALKVDPENIKALYKLACVNEAIGEVPRAKALCQQLLEKCPGHQDAIFKLASLGG